MNTSITGLNANTIEMSERIRGKGVGFDRIRRITGYLVGTLDRFNSGKAAEERDRVKHTIDSNVKSISEDEINVKETIEA